MVTTVTTLQLSQHVWQPIGWVTTTVTTLQLSQHSWQPIGWVTTDSLLPR